MGNCSSLSDVAVQSSGEYSGGLNEGDDASAQVFSNGITTGSNVSLAFECNNLPNTDVMSYSDPFVVVYQKVNDHWNEIGRTEIVVNCLNPIFVKKILTKYYFETTQFFRFEVYDADESADVKTIALDKQDFLGSAETVLSEVIHKRGVTQLGLTSNGKQRGTITIKCEELQQNNGEFIGEFVGKSISQPCFLKVFLNKAHDDEKNGLSPVYKTEVTKSGLWKPFHIPAALFCNCDFNRPIHIVLYQYKKNGNHIEKGRIKTSASKLLASKGVELAFSGGSAKASLQVKDFQFKAMPSFLQFVESGLDINFMVAIDYTGSNGNPQNASSLHYSNQTNYMRGVFNQYEKAILSVGSVLEYYDTDRLFPCYGFGACLAGSTTASHCFALNWNEMNPEVAGIQGIMDVYHSALSQVRLSGPTLFENVIGKAVETAETIKKDHNKYLIMLIITDGAIHDMDETIRLIVRGADAPLSILIVGVGNDDFKNMNTLDGDEERLQYNGKKASRDIVQFVALREMNQSAPEMIAKALLEEIPGQVTSYMDHNGIRPEEVASIRGMKY